MIYSNNRGINLFVKRKFPLINLMMFLTRLVNAIFLYHRCSRFFHAPEGSRRYSTQHGTAQSPCLPIFYRIHRKPQNISFDLKKLGRKGSACCHYFLQFKPRLFQTVFDQCKFIICPFHKCFVNILPLRIKSQAQDRPPRITVHIRSSCPGKMGHDQ